MPISILCMTDEGPRYLPTSIAAPHSLRSRPVPYSEVRPAQGDTDLAEAVYEWQMVGAAEVSLAEQALAYEAATARRFLAPASLVFAPASAPVADENPYLGRSLWVQVTGRESDVSGLARQCARAL
ncbi:hypothetical protein QTH97_16345 [Variovorax sp. J22R24]|uniref:hypothetical protein n=1 Tax=Variovorax gracilis TaxID=3053502 RepID=UPI002578516D|nr:hypothetical protein [Variovorax sp. J22R24]MDM0106517.1 hypothetical protein [Variovorax sp. J22R24]